MISAKINPLKVIFLKYILVCDTTSRVSTKKTSFQNSLVHCWNLLNQFGKQSLTQEMLLPTEKFLVQCWSKSETIATSVSECCYRWLTLFTFFWQAKEFKIYVVVWFVTIMYGKKTPTFKPFVWQKNINKVSHTYTLWVRWGFTYIFSATIFFTRRRPASTWSNFLQHQMP